MSNRGRPKKAAIALEEYPFVKDRYILGHSLKEIAADNGVTPYEVKHVLLSQGVNIRPRGRKRSEHNGA